LDGDPDALSGLLEAVQGFVNRPPQALTAADLGEQLIRLRHGIDLLELGFAADAAVFAGTDEYEVQGSTSAVDWLRHNCRMSGHAAARAVAAGEQCPSLPESVAALEAGRIGFAHFSLLAGVSRALRWWTAGNADPGDGDGGAGADGVDPATADPDPADADAADTAADAADAADTAADAADTAADAADTAADAADAAADAADAAAEAAAALALAAAASGFDERPLLALALEHSVGRFSFDCIHARHAGDAAAVLAEHVDGVERRRLELIPCEGGSLAVRGFFESIGGAAIRTALETLAKPTGIGDTRDRSRRLADAFVEIIHHALDAGALPGQSGRTHLQLTASVETVMGLVGAPGGDLEYAGAVPAATVQRLACDASIRRVLLGPGTAVIEVGRAARLPRDAARAALRVRDQGCVWPGCDRTAAWTNAHHVVHWGHGGATDLENLVLLCHRHHWSIHEGGWQLVRSDQGILVIPPNQTHRSWIRPPVAPRVE
jgi:hypothetical protein